MTPRVRCGYGLNTGRKSVTPTNLLEADPAVPTYAKSAQKTRTEVRVFPRTVLCGAVRDP